ncbi:hypothetical protein PanWU01x14_228950 [Parasponia andersonii]|uniref:Uncharacterized protein n=1 Tax=Parasponia andersonii TaxID=3476 RepID=A0A2P5BL96_PARAD|nr:hypothetical protein PanWU01x14_228950 [Parasponia andersonii]
MSWPHNLCLPWGLPASAATYVGHVSLRTTHTDICESLWGPPNQGDTSLLEVGVAGSYPLRSIRSQPLSSHVDCDLRAYTWAVDEVTWKSVSESALENGRLRFEIA